MGRVAPEAIEYCGALVLGAPRGPGHSLLTSRIGTGGRDIRSHSWMDAPCEVACPEVSQGQRLGGEMVVAERCSPRAGSDRGSVCVRVAGDGAFGWAEAANAWGATVEVLIHIKINNHVVSDVFGLPKSVDFDTAIRGFYRRPFDGVFCATIREDAEAAMVAKLFNFWQPKVALLALPVSLTRSQVRRYYTYLDQLSYAPSRCTLSHRAMGGVTQSRWRFLRMTKRATGFSPEKIMTEDSYARPLQTALDDTVGKSPHRHTLEAFSPEESLVNHNAWGRVQVPPHKGWRLVFNSDGLAPHLVNLPLLPSKWS